MRSTWILKAITPMEDYGIKEYSKGMLRQDHLSSGVKYVAYHRKD